MNPRDDIEGLLEQFGEKLREESDLADESAFAGHIGAGDEGDLLS